MSTEVSTMEVGNPMEIDGHDGSVSKATPVEVPTGNGIATGNTVGTEATAVTCDHNDFPPNEFHTCNHPYHSGYSETNLPTLLFQLDAPGNQPPGKVLTLIENGKPVLDYTGRPMRDFPFLPRYISNKVAAWLLEYWMRTDTRLTYRDIKGRMIKGDKPIPTDNALNMRRERDARAPLQLSCWTTRRGIVTKAEVERASNLNADQVVYNTTMDIEYGVVDGATQPVALRSKSLRSSASRLYPLDTFISFEAQPHIASARLKESFDMLWDLQDIALSLGMDMENWKQLPSKYLPAPWVQKSMKLRKDSAEPKAHDVNAPQKPDLLESPPESVVESPESISTVSSVSPMTPPTPNTMSYIIPLNCPHQVLYISTPTATSDAIIKRTKVTLSDILNPEPATGYGTKPESAPLAQHRPASPAPASLNRPMPKAFMSPSANLPFPPRTSYSHRVHKDNPYMRSSNGSFEKLQGFSGLFSSLRGADRGLRER